MLEQDQPNRISENFESREKLANQAENILYVGDLHGNTHEVVAQLLEMLATGESEDSEIIFTGDVVGTPDSDELQKYFYNYIRNHVNLELSDEDILNTQMVVEHPGSPNHGQTLMIRDGARLLLDKETQLAQNDNSFRGDYTDEVLANKARTTKKLVHYGHYLGNLPPSVQEQIAARFYQPMLQVMAIARQLEDEMGIKSHFVRGNHEVQPPWAFAADMEQVIPLEYHDPLLEDSAEIGVDYVANEGIVETKKTIQLLLSVSAVARANEDDGYVQQVIEEVKQHQQQAPDKKLVVVSHTQPSWLMHTGKQPNEENRRWEGGLNKFLDQLKPNEIVYGHVHNPLKNEAGEVINNYQLGEQGETQANYISIGKTLDKTFSGA